MHVLIIAMGAACSVLPHVHPSNAIAGAGVLAMNATTKRTVTPRLMIVNNVLVHHGQHGALSKDKPNGAHAHVTTQLRRVP